LVEQLTRQAPLELIVLIGTFVEEVFSPLPSFIVLVPAGVAAQVQGQPVWYLGVLALFSGVGRIAGATILYGLADKLEDVLLRRRSILGLNHEQVEAMGRRLSGSGRKEWWLLLLMNAIPIFPTAVLSLTCGFIKVPYRKFITATFLGTMVNALTYMTIGYAGLAAAGLLEGITWTARVVSVLVVLLVVLWFVRRRQRIKTTVPVVQKKTTKKGRQG
jgi:membrane protein DedA with SNARE-associated domain